MTDPDDELRKLVNSYVEAEAVTALRRRAEWLTEAYDRTDPAYRHLLVVVLPPDRLSALSPPMIEQPPVACRLHAQEMVG